MSLLHENLKLQMSQMHISAFSLSCTSTMLIASVRYLLPGYSFVPASQASQAIRLKVPLHWPPNALLAVPTSFPFHCQRLGFLGGYWSTCRRSGFAPINAPLNVYLVRKSIRSLWFNCSVLMWQYTITIINFCSPRWLNWSVIWIFCRQRPNLIPGT